ncbi:MAG: hypothetical protein CSA22_01770 [Deltaproteobacteria bacterium]|nr:MAG: hypothetical protein CSA22_01770 [Deltaproteobacteria bacterium]
MTTDMTTRPPDNALEAAITASTDPEAIYRWGRTAQSFPWDLGLKRLYALGGAQYLCWAGRGWAGADLDTCLTYLLSLRVPSHIYHAGINWKRFDFRRAQPVLMQLADPAFIFYAGAYWQVFDYAAGMNALIRTKSAEYLYRAGTLWHTFDYDAAWRIIEADPAAEDWRAKALTHPKWRAALKQIWQDAWKRSNG